VSFYRVRLPAGISPHCGADELHQATLADVLSADLPENLSEGEVWAYLRRIADNNILDALRKDRRSASRLPQSDVPVDELGLPVHDLSAADQLRLKELLADHLPKLVDARPPHHQAAAWMILERWPTKEIAASTGLHERAVQRLALDLFDQVKRLIAE
jgi:DNA-directed RNA polymerase specialized sigma24 family protein